MAAKGDVLGSIFPLTSKVSQQGDFSVGQRELWMPSPLISVKQLTKSQLNNCIGFLFDLEFVSLTSNS